MMQGLLFIFYSKLWSAVDKQLPITLNGFAMVGFQGTNVKPTNKLK
jgi:hypothetical protein